MSAKSSPRVRPVMGQLNSKREIWPTTTAQRPIYAIAHRTADKIPQSSPSLGIKYLNAHALKVTGYESTCDAPQNLPRLALYRVTTPLPDPLTGQHNPYGPGFSVTGYRAPSSHVRKCAKYQIACSYLSAFLIHWNGFVRFDIHAGREKTSRNRKG